VLILAWRLMATFRTTVCNLQTAAALKDRPSRLTDQKQKMHPKLWTADIFKSLQMIFGEGPRKKKLTWRMISKATTTTAHLPSPFVAGR
jgi:hypothetical protein